MINYLTIKNRLLVAILAFILPFSFARAEVKEDGKTISQGWYVGIEGGNLMNLRSMQILRIIDVYNFLENVSYP